MRFEAFREIISIEDQNMDSIWLHREGLFMKAYEFKLDFSAHISKNIANPLGLRLKDLSYQVCYAVSMLYDVLQQATLRSSWKGYG
jgi:hypothetical protein